MSVLKRLRAAAADPVTAGYYAWSRIATDSLLDVYRARARRAGFDRLYFILSFDCDTAKDIAAAEAVHGRLMAMGICPAYAVPGELLAEGAGVYRRIAATGAEFLNHGYRRHMYFDPESGMHKSCFFYDEEPLDAVEADIVGGDKAVTDIIGVKPRGFRTPHFGTFQTASELRYLHGLLQHLGYSFSTSTTPRFGLRYGPVFRRFGLAEIPVSGQGARPFDLLDSWGCFAAPDRALGPGDYRREALCMAERLAGGPGLLNYYADPSHVAGEAVFFDTVRDLTKVAEPITYDALLARLA